MSELQMQLQLRVEGLQCHIEDQPLFYPVSFLVSQGDVVLIVGPNGVGKSTLLKTLLGFGGEYSGQLERLPQGPNCEQLHWLSHLEECDSMLSVAENLHFYFHMLGRLPNHNDIAQVLSQAGLSPVADQPVGQLSAGQKQRLKLSRLLLFPRPIWVLDEPFTALDQQGIAWLERVLEHHCESGGMVVMSSHQPLSLKRPIQQVSLTAFDA